MCSSMENVASEIHYRTNYNCTTSDDCTEIQCTVRHSILQSINFIMNSCDHPPSMDVELHMDSDEVTRVHADSNTTTTVDSLNVDLVIDLWQFDYSMDIQVFRPPIMLTHWCNIRWPVVPAIDTQVCV